MTTLLKQAVENIKQQQQLVDILSDKPLRVIPIGQAQAPINMMINAVEVNRLAWRQMNEQQRLEHLQHLLEEKYYKAIDDAIRGLKTEDFKLDVYEYELEGEE